MTSPIATVIDGKPRDLGGFAVRRVLPTLAQRLVGPFIFFDHMGPAEFAPGKGMDVRPHPHIGLATVTYLFAGEILHRDSLGSEQTIRPGDINWMTAGRGIVHSERTSKELRQTGFKVEGLQLWVALPVAEEEAEPAFHHHPASSLPEVLRDGAVIRVLAGTAYGVTSPVRTLSPLFYVDVVLPAGCSLSVPLDYAERAAYVVSGAVSCSAPNTPGASSNSSAVRGESGHMLVFTHEAEVTLHAAADSRLVLVGGAPLDGPRHIEWNFVSSSKARIEQAKREWKAGQFPKVPGDELEFIPLPE